jgi:hypothetical protein
MTASTAEVKKARSFLYAHHKHGFRIPPKKFANSARELGVSFRELMRFLSILMARGQGGASFRMENLRAITQRGKTA